MSMLPPEMAAQMEALQHVANNRSTQPFNLGQAPNMSQSNSFNLGGPLTGAQGPGPSNNSLDANAMNAPPMHPVLTPAGAEEKWETTTAVCHGCAYGRSQSRLDKFSRPWLESWFCEAGWKDVSLHRLFQVVIHNGGHAQVANRGQWGNIALSLELPIQSQEPLPPNGTHNTTEALAQLYGAVISPVEELMLNNMRQARQKAAAMQAAGMNTGMAGTPGLPLGAGPSATTPTMNGATGFPGGPVSAGLPGTNGNGLKRKLEQLEDEAKRARMKLEPTETPNGIAQQDATAAASAVQQPSRHKITYVPLAREVETVGGHNLQEIALAHQQPRPLRSSDDWGTLEIDALTLSLRSRLSIELSYALTALSMLSTTRVSETRGFPLQKAHDLFDELLDLLEETAFPDGVPSSSPDLDAPIASNKQLIDQVFEQESRPFASLAPKDPPRERTLTAQPRHIIVTISNCIRNFATSEENAMLKTGNWRSATPVLSLADVIGLRKDALYVLSYTVEYIQLSPQGQPATEEMMQLVSEAINILASYIVDPDESLAPFATIHTPEKPQPTSLRPPPLTDLSLETFNRLAHLDSNRAVLAKLVSQDRLWTLLQSIVRRMPVIDVDFRLLRQTEWLVFTERLLLCMYTIAFIAPPSFKKKAKMDRHLGVAGTLSRMITMFSASPESRATCAVAMRRAIETMKVFDDALDSFDTSKSVTVPTLSFGMGYGEGSNANVEWGVGIYATKRDWALGLLMQQDIFQDVDVFKELESLARVQV
ncbi:hypothetical protein DL96DRAFT_1702213 [Flagelloscypha sp. PMI_526]|nr:hypothetical protein DL96DRAFT_1702213 [Flagelloscypha sp. PMI_526]